MPTIRKDNWVRIEGTEISDLKKEYGTLNNIPNSKQHVYYGTPEIQIENPYSSTHSTVYCIKNLQDHFGYSEINDINDNWSDFINQVNNYRQTHDVDITDPDTSYYYVGKPFTISQSCVIFYDDSTKSSITNAKYDYYAIILIDTVAQAKIINITAHYKEDTVPVGEQIDINQLEVYAQYDNGDQLKITSNYFIEPADKIVQILGSNVFEIFYTDPEGDINKTSFIVQGVRNLAFITGYWDGGSVAYNKEAAKKFFVIIAHYTDNTESTVNDFSFVNGNIVTETNQGKINIIYQGKTCIIEVPCYETKMSRLIAYYNGPSVEINHDYQLSYLVIKIFYSSETDINKSFYETVSIDDCTVSGTLVTNVGINSFDITYTSDKGTISSSFIVTGFQPEVKPVTIEAEYNGPGIYQGDTFNLNRITCRIGYNDGRIKTVTNFTVDTNIIHTVGINEITVTYIEDITTLTDIIYINGLEKDNTTGNNIFPVEFNNNYPLATMLNNRYRGPAEGVKTNNYANMIIKNIKTLYNIFTDLEEQYNQIINDATDSKNTKVTTLNNVVYMDYQADKILNDDHYSTGTYKSEDVAK